MKAHIIGLAGSGKTTLARWLAGTYAIGACDLDDVVYDRVTGERPATEIERRLEEIGRLPGWVTEGAYHQPWLKQHLDAAEIIVWLDISFPICAKRIVLRHVGAELAGRNPHPGWRKMARFLNYTRQTASRQRAETKCLIDPFSAKVMHCRSSTNVKAFQAHRSGASGFR